MVSTVLTQEIHVPEFSLQGEVFAMLNADPESGGWLDGQSIHQTLSSRVQYQNIPENFQCGIFHFHFPWAFMITRG